MLLYRIHAGITASSYLFLLLCQEYHVSKIRECTKLSLKINLVLAFVSAKDGMPMQRVILTGFLNNLTVLLWSQWSRCVTKFTVGYLCVFVS